MRSTTLVALSCFAVSMTATTASAETLSPGRSIALSADGPTVLSNFGGTEVEIEKARRKSVLLIDGTVSFRQSSVEALELDTQAFPGTDEGLPVVDGQGGVFSTNCDSGLLFGTCTVSGHWWLDIDALEAANPGKWANHPLIVQLRTSRTPGTGGGLGSYSLRVQMLKK